MEQQGEDRFGLVGVTLAGRFRVESVVGHGGFGTVYRGTHLNLQSPVAVKCLRVPPGMDAAKQQEFIQRFLTEGRLMHELSRADAGIAQALEVEVFRLPTGEPVPYMVLEWVEGRSLEEVVQQGRRTGARVPLEQLLGLLDSVARALGVAHAKNIAHRDVKPSNIMLTDALGRTNAKLLDFGVAKIMQGTGGAMTTRGQESSGAFTPMYAAPEQWVARFGATGPWTDVFSFSLVCVELLTAAQALPGEEASQWIGACLDPGCRPTPRERGVDLGEQVEAVFRRAVALDPKHRFQTVTEFWKELKSAARVAVSASEAPPAKGTVQAGPALQSIIAQAYRDGAIPPAGTGTALTPRAGGAAVDLVPPPPSPGGTQAPQAAGVGGPTGWLQALSPTARFSLLGALSAAGLLVLILVVRALGGRGSSDTAESASPLAIGSATSGATELAPETPATASASASAATLSVFCVPGCDAISIDRSPVGPSPVVGKSVPPGSHAIAAERLGASPVQQSVQVAQGAQATVRLWMNP
jgi:serine/threonine-protein kinase